MNPLVSVIIPTYNRFKNLLKAIESVKNQTYQFIEIIVVNDFSTQKEYYEYDFKDVKMVHLDKNTKVIYGFACAGYVRNIGIENSSGEYIAFLDDDDCFLPHKIELQLKEIQKSGLKMSATDGYIGKGIYDKDSCYQRYNGECHLSFLKKQLILEDLPEIWTRELIEKHNAIICSSVMVHKDILSKVNKFKSVRNGDEDYACWLECLKHTNLIYVKEPCVYYDDNHGRD